MIAILSFLVSIAGAQEDCQVSCTGGDDVSISVDLGAHCLCMKDSGWASGKKCIKISIGSEGPSMTSTLGTPTEMKGCDGHKYKYKDGPGTTNVRDGDCIATGVPANDGVGKWIHKVAGNGGTNSTRGCIGIPGRYWPDVKKAALGDPPKKDGAKKKLNICGGANMSSGTAGSAAGPGSNR